MFYQPVILKRQLVKLIYCIINGCKCKLVFMVFDSGFHIISAHILGLVQNQSVKGLVKFGTTVY